MGGKRLKNPLLPHTVKVTKGVLLFKIILFILITICICFSNNIDLNGKLFTQYSMLAKVGDSLAYVDVCCLEFKDNRKFNLTSNSYYVKQDGYSYWDEQGGAVFQSGNYNIVNDTIILNFNELHTIRASLQDTLSQQRLYYKNDTLITIDQKINSSAQIQNDTTKLNFVDKLLFENANIHVGLYIRNMTERCMNMPIQHKDIYDCIFGNNKSNCPKVEGL